MVQYSGTSNLDFSPQTFNDVTVIIRAVSSVTTLGLKGAVRDGARDEESSSWGCSALVGGTGLSTSGPMSSSALTSSETWASEGNHGTGRNGDGGHPYRGAGDRGLASRAEQRG